MMMMKTFNKRRMPLVWNLLLILFATASLGNTAEAQSTQAPSDGTSVSGGYTTNETDHDLEGFLNDFLNATQASSIKRYDLPSFALTLKVTKKDNALILFQDRLQETIQIHLENFYKTKMENPSIIGSPTTVNVKLDSKLVWRELSSTNQMEGSSTIEEYQPQMQTLEKEYEVRGLYDCQVSLSYIVNDDDNDNKRVFLTESLMTLFFIEAFQADNYWDLLHSFLASPTLQDINDVQITVLESGFVPYDGGRPSLDDDWYGSGSGSLYRAGEENTLTRGTIVGVVFATFFCIGLVGIWIYLCFMAPGMSFFKIQKQRHQEGLYKDGSVTDDACTNESMDFTPEEESTWMDAWAQNVTSIPLRDPHSVSKKKKRGQPIKQSFLRPAQEHSTSLDCIDEADNESCASTVASNKTTASSSTRRSANKKKRGKHSSQKQLQKGHCATIEESFSNDSITSSPKTTTRLDYEDYNDVEVQRPSLENSSIATATSTYDWNEDTPSVTSLDVQQRLSL